MFRIISINRIAKSPTIINDGINNVIMPNAISGVNATNVAVNKSVIITLFILYFTLRDKIRDVLVYVTKYIYLSFFKIIV